MDFTLTDDQRMLKDSVERMLADTYGFAQRKGYIAEPDGWSRDQWRRFAELGLLGLPFAESLGGFDGGPVETMIVMEAFGSALMVEPYLPTVILAGGLVRLAGSQAQSERLVPSIVGGELLGAFAHSEADARYDLNHVATTARREGDNWVLDGRKRHVLGGGSAGFLIVSARVSGDVSDADGIALFIVDPESPGVSRRAYKLQDDTSAAEVTLEGVRVGPEDLLGPEGGAAPLIARVAAQAVAALCCEAVGAMDTALSLTLEHLKTRKQFGATLGSFQALQHRAVDMYVELELARSIAMHAIVFSASEDRSESELAASAAKVQIGKAMRLVGGEAVQMHGGIGLTEECAVGHYYRRMTMIQTMFGDAAHHRLKVAEAGGLIEPAFHAVL